MILYKKRDNEQNILDYKYIYEDKNNYVFIDFAESKILYLYVYEKEFLTKQDVDDWDCVLAECYKVVHYGKLKFQVGQKNLY